MITFVVALIMGVFIGFFACCIFMVGGRADERAAEMGRLHAREEHGTTGGLKVQDSRYPPDFQDPTRLQAVGTLIIEDSGEMWVRILEPKLPKGRYNLKVES